MDAVLEMALQVFPANEKGEAEPAMVRAKATEHFMLSHLGRETHGWVPVGMASLPTNVCVTPVKRFQSPAHVPLLCLSTLGATIE